MDYQRIYDDLIEHRKMLPKLEGEYYERHHILPVCLGGSDDADNLVYLTAEDHFIAHLLLAKAHGGALWHAANMMCLQRDGREIKHRRAFALIRKEHAKVISGEGSPTMDRTVYKLLRVATGEEFNLTQKQMRAEFGMTPAQSSDLVTGHTKTSKGISLFDTPRKEDWRISQECSFKNIRTGDIDRLTPLAFMQKYSIPHFCVKSLVDGKYNSARGFTIEGRDVSASMYDWTQYEFVDISTGESITAIRSDFAKMKGLHYSHLDVIIKEGRASQGYALASAFRG